MKMYQVLVKRTYDPALQAVRAQFHKALTELGGFSLELEADGFWFDSGGQFSSGRFDWWVVAVEPDMRQEIIALIRPYMVLVNELTAYMVLPDGPIEAVHAV